VVLSLIVTVTVIVVLVVVIAAGYAIDRSVPDDAREDGVGTGAPLVR
jgi:hypothetical protein